ncbi:MAG: choice-of-anchor D domain-containing protein, partial [Bacteroidota bacterium]
GFLLPGDTARIAVTFAPTVAGTFTDSLRIFNNATDTFLCVNAIAFPRPIVALDPDSISATLACIDSVTVPVKVFNTGGSDLIATFSSDTLFRETSDIFFTVTGENTIHTFNNIPSADSMILIVSLNGDYDGTFESASLFVDGVALGVIDDQEVPNGTTVSDTFFIGSAQAGVFLADGQAVVTVDNNASVNVGLGGTSLNRVRLIVPGAPWITSTPTAGTVVPGDSLTLMVTLNSTGLIAGSHTGNLLVATNDPLNPQTLFKVDLNVIGVPIIALSDSCVAVDSTMEFTTRTDTFRISNTGCAPLFLDSVSNALSIFSVAPTLDTLPLGDTLELVVTFSPTAPGTFLDTLHLFSNAGDTTVCLSGLAFPRPIVATQPDTLTASLDCVDSTTVTLKVLNTGGSDLIASWSTDTSFAQSNDSIFTTTGENTDHVFTGLLPTSDSLIIVVTLNGDYDGA